MSDLDGAAPAAAEPISAPAPQPTEVVAPPPKPVEDGPSTPEAEPKKEPAKAPTSREAIQKAAEKVNKDEAAKAKTKEPEPSKDAAKEPAKDEGPARDETGKFASKDGKEPAEKPVQADTAPRPPEPAPKPVVPASDAPARLSSAAKAEWEKVPDTVKFEVARLDREAAAGVEKYRASHEAFEQVREFHEMAQKGGTDLKTALTKYVGMENMLRTDPIRGLEEICSNIGVSLKDVAAHIMGQKPEESQSRSDATIRELRQELAGLKEQVGGVTQTIQQQRTDMTLREITSFAETHPRFDELASSIGKLLETKMAANLPEAYEMAERLNPAPASASPSTLAQTQTAALSTVAQTDRGSKSIAGAPSPGSNPAAKQPSKSSREAVRRAFAQAG